MEFGREVEVTVIPTLPVSVMLCLALLVAPKIVEELSTLETSDGLEDAAYVEVGSKSDVTMIYAPSAVVTPKLSASVLL